MRSLKDVTVQNALQLQRMFWHMSGCLLVGGTYLWAQPTRQEGLIILAPFVMLFTILDLGRFVVTPWGRFCAKRYIGVFMREEELHFPSALTFALLGMIGAVYLFPREIAGTSILLVGIVDPVARFAGVMWGRLKIGTLKKTVVGTLGGLAAGLLVACGLTLHAAPFLTFSTLASGSVSASIIEVVGGRIDNFLIPVGSGAIMWCMA